MADDISKQASYQVRISTKGFESSNEEVTFKIPKNDFNDATAWADSWQDLLNAIDKSLLQTTNYTLFDPNSEQSINKMEQFVTYFKDYGNVTDKTISFQLKVFRTICGLEAM